MPSLCEEVKKYTLDAMILEHNYDKKCPSKDDERVHQFYKDNVEEVIDNGQRRIQLPLPWKDRPINKPESRWTAEKKFKKPTPKIGKATGK